MRWVDYKEIKTKVSIRDVLSYYDAQGLKDSGDKLVGPCPVHGGDSLTAFHVDLERNIWHCFSGCKKGGNVLDLVAQIEDCSIRDAALMLQDRFLAEDAARDPVPQPPGSTRSQKVARKEHSARATEAQVLPVKTNQPLSFTLNLSADHPYLLKERSLTEQTIEHFRIGYCHKGTLRGRIAIPIHDQQDNLVAYAGRSIKQGDGDPSRPKYKFPRGFHKQLVLYNLNRAKQAIEELGEIILVEGFFDIFRLFEAGYQNVVALMGSAMSLEQESLIRQACSSVTLFFDGDEAGQDCAEDCLWRLVHDLHVRLVDIEEGRQPNNLVLDQIKELLG